MRKLNDYLLIGFLAILFSACGSEVEDSETSGLGQESEDELYYGSASSAQTSAPQTYLNKSNLPVDGATQTTATFRFRCNQADCIFKCKMDKNPWKRCKSPKTYTGLNTVQRHTFKVKAGNRSGLWDRTPATHSWILFAPATHLTAGDDHNCAITDAGAVKCWGDNIEGQLGDGTTITRKVPVSVPELSSGVVAVAGGYRHTCALLSTGGVKCWGSNHYGQLGNGTNTNSKTPVEVSGLDSITAISSGFCHMCALNSSGGVKCWGMNTYGQLGDGSTVSRNVPVEVSGLSTGVSAISAGASHTCVLLSSTGGVQCWGHNFYGQLGEGSTVNTIRKTPIDVSGLTSGVSAISAGGSHTCALLSSGGVKCWGWNSYGQIGDGTNLVRKVPTDVSGLSSGVDLIKAGKDHTCAHLSSGGMKCWGRNSFGALGNGTTNHSNLPVDVSGTFTVLKTIAGGSFHTCVLFTFGGSIMCWGHNNYGQLGDGTTTDRSVPGYVPGFGT